MRNRNFKEHIDSPKSLITTYEQTRAGFVSLALEKNRKASPYVEEAKALKALTQKIKNPSQLIEIADLRPSILTAAGISDKALLYLTEENKEKAVKNLIKIF